MEEVDKRCPTIRKGVNGECFFWYRPTQVVTDKRPLNVNKELRERLGMNNIALVLQQNRLQLCVCPVPSSWQHVLCVGLSLVLYL